MRAIKTALMIGLAACVAATSGLARETSSGKSSQKSSRSASAKKKNGASSKSRKTKSRKKQTRERHTEAERFAQGFDNLPPEDLPEPETEADMTDGEPPQLR